MNCNLTDEERKTKKTRCRSWDCSACNNFYTSCLNEEINKLEKELQIERNRLNWLVDNNYVVTAGVNSFWVSEVDGQYRLGPKFSTARDAIDECMKFNP